MNTPYFIAQRIRKAGQGKFTTIAHRIGIVSIALGLSAMLLSMMCLGGFQKSIKSKIFSFHGQLQLVNYQQGHPIHRAQASYLPEKYPRFITSMRPYAMKTALMQINGEVEGVLLKGLPKATQKEEMASYLIAGRMPQDNLNEIVVSERLAQQYQLKVGDTVVTCFVQKPPRYRKLILTGIYSTAIPEVDDKVVLAHLSLIQKLNHWSSDQAEGYELLLSSDIDPLSLRREIISSLDYGLAVKSTNRMFLPIFEWLDVSESHVVICIFLILLVACSNIASIMLIQAMERVRMIGILKTLGASNAFIRKIFFFNGLHILGKGILMGNCTAFFLAFIQHYGKVLKLDPESYYMHYLVIDWNWRVILFFNIIIFAMVAVVLAAAVSLMTRVRPLTATRFN